MRKGPTPPQCGNYHVGHLIGQGGTGQVFAGEQSLTGRRVAIKVLSDELSSSRATIARFFYETRAAARVQHPGMVDVIDSGYTDDGRAFIVMELLEGESLGARLARAPKPDLTFAGYVGVEIARIIAAAHAAQIIHRDLKPDNTFLVRDGSRPFGARVKVLDFGMAKLGPEGGPRSFVTEPGSLLGTPLYMAPEQCRGDDIDARVDIYALGCILYEMACGRPPFIEGSVGMILGAHVYEPVRPPRSFAPHLPARFEALLLRALAKKPDDRFPTMDALALELSSIGAR